MANSNSIVSLYYKQIAHLAQGFTPAQVVKLDKSLWPICCAVNEIPLTYVEQLARKKAESRKRTPTRRASTYRPTPKNITLPRGLVHDLHLSMAEQLDRVNHPLPPSQIVEKMVNGGDDA